MWFNVLMLILMIYAMLTPFMMVYCIKFGCRLAENPKKESEKPIVERKAKPKKMTQEEINEQQFLQNLMNYNGTSMGQVRIGSKK